MSTGHRGAYIRGISTLLDADTGVDAAGATDCVINNLGHLYDASHPHIVNLVTAAGLNSALRQDDPSPHYYKPIDRWPFPLWLARDGSSAKVVYRIKVYRSGESGSSVTIGVRIGVGGGARTPFFDVTSPTQATHTTSSTTPVAFSGVLYLPSERVESAHPPRIYSGGYAGSGTTGSGVPSRQAWFELWCTYTGSKSKPSVRVSSVHARQYWREV